METIDLKKFLKKAGFKPYVKIQKKQAYAATYDALLKSKLPIIKETPVDTGLMASSWEIIKKNENELLFGNTAPYSFDVEHGTEPRMLSNEEIESLKMWVARKLIKKRPIDINSKEVLSTTWAIVNTVKAKGRQPTFLLRKALKKIIEPNIIKNLKKIKKDKDEFIQGLS